MGPFSHLGIDNMWEIIRDLLIFALWLHTWLNSRQAVTEKTIRELDNELKLAIGSHSERITRMEQNQHHALTKEDLIRVHQRLDKLDQEINRLGGEFAEIKRTLALIHEVMISK